jgi:hypothetical protein
MRTVNPQSRGGLQVPVADSLILDGGTWKHTEQQGWLIATVTPPSVPMFQQVVAYLETKPVPRGGNFRRADEARAAVAVCLRWGSYFAVLADAARPDAPDIADEPVSHIDDAEMARMNIEISAALAWWLTLRGADDRRYWDLVHRALEYLPTGPKTVRPLLHGDRLLACAMPEMAAHVRRTWPAERMEGDLATAEEHSVRIIANTITHVAWRNGPVENVHAGQCHGYDLDRRRVLPKAEKAIIRQAQSGFSTGLKVADLLTYDNAWPPPAERVLPFMHGLIGPSRWSLTDSNRMAELPLRPVDPARS